MSDTEYTPTTDTVRRYFVEGQSISAVTEHYAVAEFNRWLAEHDRVTAERAWTEGAIDNQWNTEHPIAVQIPNPYTVDP